MTRQRVSNIVEKLQLWFISIAVAFFIWFGKDMYTMTRDNHDNNVLLQAKQAETDKTLDRHEEAITQLRNK